MHPCAHASQELHLVDRSEALQRRSLQRSEDAQRRDLLSLFEETRPISLADSLQVRAFWGGSGSGSEAGVKSNSKRRHAAHQKGTKVLKIYHPARSAGA